jgi:cysteine desulfurase
MHRIYLDHNATTPTAPEVQDVILRAYTELSGNPSSVHREGQRARAAVEEARRQVAELIGAHSTEITFTSGATEANNIAMSTLSARGGVVTTAVEHPSILAPLDRLRSRGGATDLVPVDPLGALDLDELFARTKACGAQGLSVMFANNETGRIYPIADLCERAHRQGLIVHCDATQAAGKLPLNVSELGVDMLSISAHKFYGPKGAGALFVSSALTLDPVILGGHQERGRRGGTENVPAIVGMGAAAALAGRHQEADTERMGRLRDQLWEGIRALCPEAALQTHAPCLSNTLNVRFKDVDGETLLINLDLEGIAVSAGSACTAGSMEPSHVILAMGVPYNEARGSIRFSLGRQTSRDDIEHTLKRLPRVLSRSRDAAW